LDNGIGIHTDRRQGDIALEISAHLGPDRFDGAQYKTKFGDVLVSSNQEIVNRRERGRN
jgi:hypothetical protein